MSAPKLNETTYYDRRPVVIKKAPQPVDAKALRRLRLREWVPMLAGFATVMMVAVVAVVAVVRI